MFFNPLLADYSGILSNVIINLALKNKNYCHDNRKNTPSLWQYMDVGV